MRKPKVLIVEDDPDIAASIRYSLELNKGIECLQALDGKEALKKAREESPDLIILDVMLPKMDGFQVSRLLKFDEMYKHIPIIMLTARAQDSDQALGMETGADEYVTKPFSLDALLGLVMQYLEQNRGDAG